MVQDNEAHEISLSPSSYTEPHRTCLFGHEKERVKHRSSKLKPSDLHKPDLDPADGTFNYIITSLAKKIILNAAETYGGRIHIS
jgi:hypothetical protein